MSKELIGLRKQQLSAAIQIVARTGAAGELTDLYADLHGVDPESYNDSEWSDKIDDAFTRATSLPARKTAEIIPFEPVIVPKKALSTAVSTETNNTQPSLSDISSRIDLRSVVENAWGIKLKGGGRWRRSRAIYRGGSDPNSFAVNEATFKDHVNGASGSVYDFFQLAYHVNFPRAIEMAKEWLGEGNIEDKPVIAHPEADAAMPPDRIWQQTAESELKRAEAHLWLGDKTSEKWKIILQYVYGLSDDQIKRGRYGINPTWRKTGYRFEDEAGKLKHAWIPPGIIIPRIHDGVFYGIRVRTPVGKIARVLNIPEATFDRGDRAGSPMDKYLSMTGSRPMLSMLGESKIDTARFALIVEGEFDRSCAEQRLPDEVAVLTMGGAATAIPLRVIERMKASAIEKILICTDRDNAGRAGAARYKAQLAGKITEVVSLPEKQGKDFCEFVIDYEGDVNAWWKGVSGV